MKHFPRKRTAGVILAALVLSSAAALAWRPHAEKVCYWSEHPDAAHQMEIVLPRIKKGKKAPLVVFIHGGAWISGRDSNPKWVSSFVDKGYAVALVNYRYAQEGRFPAQIEDLNSALRFIKQNAERYQIDPEKIGVWGTSAGGHLAALLGTIGDGDLGHLGGNGNQAIRVRAVCDWCGPTDLFALGTRMYPGIQYDWMSPMAPLTLFLGGQAMHAKDAAAAASPISYVSADDPPFLILHGTEDPIVPVDQSKALADGLTRAGAKAIYQQLEGEKHEILNRKTLQTTIKFFDEHLK